MGKISRVVLSYGRGIVLFWRSVQAFCMLFTEVRIAQLEKNVDENRFTELE